MVELLVMKIAPEVPTHFAKNIARKFRLLPEINETLTDIEMYNKLAEFQTMALGCEFADALIVYHGTELSEEQENALQVIHASTKPFVVGQLTSELLWRLKEDNRDAVEAAKLLVKLFMEAEGSEWGEDDDDDVTRLVYSVVKGKKKKREKTDG